MPGLTADSLLLSPQLSAKQTPKGKKEPDGWDKYTVVSILGEGSYGMVYKVTRKSDENLKKAAEAHKGKAVNSIRRLNQAPEFLVVKELQTDIMPKREALQALNEIDVHGQLQDHPYTVKYHDSFISGTKVNIVMEYC